MRAARGVVTVTVALLALTSCSSSATTPLAAAAQRVGDLTMLEASASEVDDPLVEQAVFEGHLTKDSSTGCLVGEADGALRGLVFPQGTTLRDDIVVLPDETRLAVGEQFVAGGGYYDASSAIDDSCGQVSYFFVSGIG